MKRSAFEWIWVFFSEASRVGVGIHVRGISASEVEVLQRHVGGMYVLSASEVEVLRRHEAMSVALCIYSVHPFSQHGTVQSCHWLLVLGRRHLVAESEDYI